MTTTFTNVLVYSDNHNYLSSLNHVNFKLRHITIYIYIYIY